MKTEAPFLPSALLPRPDFSGAPQTLAELADLFDRTAQTTRRIAHNMAQEAALWGGDLNNPGMESAQLECAAVIQAEARHYAAAAVLIRRFDAEKSTSSEGTAA